MYRIENTPSEMEEEEEEEEEEVFIHCRNQLGRDVDREEDGGLCALQKPNKKRCR